MQELKVGDLVWVNEKADMDHGIGYFWWGKILAIYDSWAKIVDQSDSIFHGDTFMRHISLLEPKSDN